MLNQFIVVGRLTKEIELREENDSKYAILTLAVPRSFKNVDGIYDTDILEFKTFGTVAENSSEYCNKGDIIGVKGRIQRLEDNPSVELIAEKITFLSTKPKNEK